MQNEMGLMTDAGVRIEPMEQSHVQLWLGQKQAKPTADRIVRNRWEPSLFGLSKIFIPVQNKDLYKLQWKLHELFQQAWGLYVLAFLWFNQEVILVQNKDTNYNENFMSSPTSLWLIRTRLSLV